MSNDNSSEDMGVKPPLALIAGPTASGKSDLAVRLAVALREKGRRAVVINADSAQVYADLSILSARPTQAEMRGIPHRLFGAWDGATSCSAAEWAAAARREVADAHAAGEVPILVGGTGLYIRTLLEGIAPIPQIEAEVREAVRALPVGEAYAALRSEDPQRAAMLAPADTTRVLRALEVVRSTGRSLLEWQEERQGGIGDGISLHPAILVPDRMKLYERCDTRFERMLREGAIAEVEALLSRRLNPASPVMRAIGVGEIAGFLSGLWTIDEASRRASQATRNYAKRQLTWLRHQPPVSWPRFEEDNFSENSLFVSLLQ